MNIVTKTTCIKNKEMMDKEKFINEIAEVVNRNSMERAFNDTPDYILGRIAVEAMELFACASMRRDDYHGFKTADCGRELICKKKNKQDVRNVPKEAHKAITDFFANIFSGHNIQIQYVDLKKRNPRNKRRGKNKQKKLRQNKKICIDFSVK